MQPRTLAAIAALRNRIGARSLGCWLAGCVALAALGGCRGTSGLEGQVVEVLSDGRRAQRYEFDWGGVRLAAGDLDGRWLELDLGAAPFGAWIGLEPRWRDGTKPLWSVSVSTPPGAVEQRFEARPGIALVRRAERLGVPGAQPAGLCFSARVEAAQGRALLDADRQRLITGFALELDPTLACLLEIPAVGAEFDGQAQVLPGGPFDFTTPRSPLGQVPASGEAARACRFLFAPGRPGELALRARLTAGGGTLELWSDASSLELALSAGERPRLALTPLEQESAGGSAQAAEGTAGSGVRSIWLRRS